MRSDTQDRLRHELRGVVVLEAVQLTIGIGSLVVLALHAAFSSPEPRTAAVGFAFVALALVNVAMALRVRAGGDLLRRDLCIAEASAGPVERRGGEGPYRSVPMPPERELPRPDGRRISRLVLLGASLAISTLTGVGLATMR